ncbi:hypothetical protein A6F57_16360 [Alteromonas stellipolaris]|uniref:RHS repeat domain-containing protein n=2 Tax=Alteromonas TaxID=226 RepID=UPI0007B4526D|nr:RHS repeat-associated core domain-containing protein [Alteromonas stellipolaris]ANB26619.1 hypothetical protein A6F57_16360 [Alteromonas stellipolaris]
MPSIFDDSIDYQYDGFGNLKKKNGVSNYNYSDANRVHRLTSATGFGSFAYDYNGNIRSDGTGRTFNYGTYDKPTRITKGGLYADMKYGVERELYFKKEKRVEAGKTNEYQTIYLGNYEEVRRTGGSGSSTEHKYYIAGDIVISHRSNGTKEYSYLHKDHQGSITTVTNVNGTVVQQAFFDPFGKRTQIHQASVFANSSYMQPTDRGYTGHNMMDGLGIIHMNGRIYDPTLGRFLQADPHIQAPNNSQSYNRYAYVLNNPMSYTDPSGYFFNKLFKGLNKALGKFAPVFGIALLAIPGVGQWAAVSMWNAAAIGFVSGGVATGSLKGALIGAFSGAAFHQIGQAFNGKGGAFWESGGAGHIGSHAVTGGVISTLSGGKFGHGFFSAGFTKFAMGNAGFDYDDISPSAMAGRTAISATIGGTASVISGGKFANGAQTAAMAQLFNAEATNYRQKIKGWRAAEAAVRKRFVKNGYTIVSGRTSAKYDGDWYIRGREFDVVAYKVVNGERMYELVEVKFLKSNGLKYATGPARRAVGMRKVMQALTVSRQVHFDLNADAITLSGRGFGSPLTINSSNYNISWEFVRPNGTGASINVSNTAEFTNRILELTGG